MNSSTQQPEKKEIEPPLSFAERRKIRESMKDAQGTNRYGGARCTCHCGNVHWKPREVETEQAK